MDIQLTENFKLGEFAVSRDHPGMAGDIIFTDWETERVRMLCAAWLQPLREALGPVEILSGKRTPDLNAAVGGAINSDHLFSLNPLHSDAGAADFHVVGVSIRDAADWLIANTTNFKLLLIYSDRGFLHMSTPDSSGILGRVRNK